MNPMAKPWWDNVGNKAVILGKKKSPFPLFTNNENALFMPPFSILGSQLIDEKFCDHLV